ncbi:MAG: HGxxPAAW family protein [Microbacteriaceae bacterium]
MSHDANDPGHGNSPAAWTAVVIMLLAVTIGTVFFFLDVPALVWASVGLFLVGALVGYVLKRLGYGVGGARLEPARGETQH